MKAKGSDKKKLMNVISKKGVKRHQVDMYKDIYERLGVIGDAKSEIKFYTNRALRSLKVLRREEDRKIFGWLADSLIKRIK